MAPTAYMQSSVLLTWERRTPHAVARRDAFSQSRQRTVRWIDLYMCPVTWEIVDRTGYDSAMTILRDAHRPAVAVCRDSGKYRTDPTKAGYRNPDSASIQAEALPHRVGSSVRLVALRLSARTRLP